MRSNARKKPRLLALGLPMAVLSQCAPNNGCAPASPAAAGFSVTGVVDGDTVDTTAGRVRLIGIDTPEIGECGYAEAKARLEQLVLNRGVALPGGARDDADDYGRLLRYVDVSGTDAGRMLINEGLAVVRYDSHNGYGSHPREADYAALDAATPNMCPVPAPTPEPAPPLCEPFYPTLCLPPGIDVDCGGIPQRNFPVRAPDPFRLDGDGDGTGCET